MTLRYTLSQLSRSEARRAFGRSWLGICAAGFLMSLLVFGGRHAFILATVWFLIVFAPVRIAVELLHTLGPRIRRQMLLDLERDPDRYATRERIALRIEALFSREVHLPRIAGVGVGMRGPWSRFSQAPSPAHTGIPSSEVGAKVMEAAVALTDQAFRGGDGPIGVLRATAVCRTLLERWMASIAAGERGTILPPPPPAPSIHAQDGAEPPALWDPQASIQEQWVTLRAVAALAALTKTLTAVYEDRAGPPSSGRPALSS